MLINEKQKRLLRDCKDPNPASNSFKRNNSTRIVLRRLQNLACNRQKRLERWGEPFVLVPEHLRHDAELLPLPGERNQTLLLQFPFDRYGWQKGHPHSSYGTLFDGLHTAKFKIGCDMHALLV